MAPRRFVHKNHYIARCVALIMICTVSVAYGNTPLEVRQMLRLGDYESAEKLLLENSADPLQAFQLARLYQKKLITPRHPDDAYRLFKQAADAGHVEATYQLAKYYERGEQTSQNIELARATYQKAMRLDHPRAAQALARLSAQNNLPDLSIEDALRQCNEKAIIKAAEGHRDFVQSWLFEAIDCKGSELLYGALLQAGGNPNARDERKNLAIHRAVALEAINAVMVLKRAGADLSKKNEQGWSATMLAERSVNKELRKVFDIAGTQSTRSNSTDLSIASQETRFQGWSSLHIAAWRGDVELTKKLLRKGMSVNKLDSTGSTALRRALQSRNIDTTHILLDHGAKISSADFDLIANHNDEKLTAALVHSGENIVREFFCYSLTEGDDQALETLFTQKAPVPAKCGDNPSLVLASRNGNGAAVRSILKEPLDVDAADELGCTALCWAVKNEHHNISHTLLAAGANNQPDHNGTTPLMWAAQIGDLDTVQQLVERKAHVNHQSESGSHALLLAAAAGHARIVEFLLANDASIDLKNALGDTALIASVQADNYDTAKVLVSSGASTRAKNEMFVSARELLRSKDEHWQKLIDERSSFWSLIN